MYNINCPEPARTGLIQSEDELHTVLLKYAAQDVELRMYPRSVVNFAERVLTDLYSGVDLDELKYPPDESRPLLVQSLLDTSNQEMRPYDPKLIELASRIYSHPSLYPALEQTNREFIKLLNLGQWFEQEHEFGQSTLVSRERFRREFGTDVRISGVHLRRDPPETLRIRPALVGNEVTNATLHNHRTCWSGCLLDSSCSRVYHTLQHQDEGWPSPTCL